MKKIALAVVIVAAVFFFQGGQSLRANQNVAGWGGRDYVLHLPDTSEEGYKMPVIIALHGAGGNALRMERLTCPRGKRGDEACLHNVAIRQGYAVVIPQGIKNRRGIFAGRVWNSGGGSDGYAPMAGAAYEQDIDDVEYLEDVIDDLASDISIDPSRIFIVGISNGASMAYRMACESDIVRAIAPVAGGNQFTTSAECNLERDVSILHIHGTNDGSWPYEGGEGERTPGMKISVAESINEWSEQYGCRTLEATEISDAGATSRDGTVAEFFSLCDEDSQNKLNVIRVTDGGHTWPGGYQYAPQRTVGRVSEQIQATAEILDFFDSHK